MNHFKANGIITSIDNIRGLEYEKEKPLVGDKIYISRYMGEGSDKIAVCNDLSRQTKPFGIPETDFRKIIYKPLFKYEYKKDVMENIPEDYLDKNGQEGWELITIESGGFSKYKTIYFKRIINEEGEII